MKTLIAILLLSSAAFAGQSKDNGGDPRVAREFFEKKEQARLAELARTNEVATYQKKFCISARDGLDDLDLLVNSGVSSVPYQYLRLMRMRLASICLPNSDLFLMDRKLVDSKGQPRLAGNDGQSQVVINPTRWDEIEAQPNSAVELRVTATHEMLSLWNQESDGDYKYSSQLYDTARLDAFSKANHSYARAFSNLRRITGGTPTILGNIALASETFDRVIKNGSAFWIWDASYHLEIGYGPQLDLAAMPLCDSSGGNEFAATMTRVVSLGRAEDAFLAIEKALNAAKIPNEVLFFVLNTYKEINILSVKADYSGERNRRYPVCLKDALASQKR